MKAMTESKKIELAKMAVRKVRDGGPVNGEADGIHWNVEDKGRGVVEFTLGADRFLVTGAQRLTVKKVARAEDKPRKAKAGTKAVGPTIDATCRECGKSFKLSKFTPYLDLCYDCRKAIKAKGKLLPTTGKIQRVCEVTGKTFMVSKYNPYITISPEGKKQLAGKSA